MPEPNSDPEAIRQTMKKSVAVLQDAGIPFALAGGMACWARGGPESDHDIDYDVLPEDVDRALEALEASGFRPEKGPEKAWLCKAFSHDDVMVDLIFDPVGRPVSAILEDAEEMDVLGVRLAVATVNDVLISKLSAMTETHMDFKSALDVVRPLREQIDWERVKAETAGSPFAAAFFTLAAELGVAPAGSAR